MDTAVQTSSRPQLPSPSERPPSERPPSERPSSEQEQKLENLVVHVDNNCGQERYSSLSEKRKQIAARAKQTHKQQVKYNPNHQPIANLSYQYSQVHASPLCQSTPIVTPTMQQVYYTNPYESQYPPMPVYPHPVAFNPPMPAPMPEPMPEAPTELNGTTPVHNRLGKQVNPIIEHYKLVQRGEISNTRPNNLRFAPAVTPRSTNPKSFFHISTYEQSPSTRLSETIWFKNDDPRLYADPDNEQYNPLLSFLNWSNIPYENKLHHFRIEEFHSQQQRLPDFLPPIPCETVETIKTSTRNMGRDVVYHQRYPQRKQFYSLTEKFLYRYNYKFTLPRNPVSFNFLHTTPKDVQRNNFKVHETKLIHNLIYYTYLRDNLPHENFIYVNDQMTSPYFMKFAYIVKNKYMKGTLRNFDPVKNYYIFQPTENPERPFMIPIEALEPAENCHTSH